MKIRKKGKRNGGRISQSESNRRNHQSWQSGGGSMSDCGLKFTKVRVNGVTGFQVEG